MKKMTKAILALVLTLSIVVESSTIASAGEASRNVVLSTQAILDATPATIDIDALEEELEQIDINGEIFYSYYKDTGNGNVVLIFDENKNLIQKASTDKTNGRVTETIYYNKSRAASTENVYNLSDLVKESDLPEAEQQEGVGDDSISTFATIPSYNYLFNEPLLGNKGLTKWSDGYYYLGSSKSSTLPYTAYLFRQQSTSNSSAKTYNFSKGTTLATLVSVLGVVLTGITTATVSFLLASVLVGGVVDYACSPDIGVKNIHNLYRSRVGKSYTLRYSCCKSINYWYSKVWDKKKNDYKNSYDYKNFVHGYPSSIDMINTEGINCEAQGIVINRPHV